MSKEKNKDQEKTITVEDLRKEIDLGNDYRGFIKIETYLPFAVKMNICDSIMDSCMVPVEGTNMVKCDHYNLHIAYESALIMNYSNINMSEELIDDYDYLKENSIVDYVIDSILQNEKEFIENMVDWEIDERQKIENSLEYIVSLGLNKLLENIPSGKEFDKLIDKAKKEFENFDPNKLEMIKDLQNGIDNKDNDIEKAKNKKKPGRPKKENKNN